MRGTRAGLRIRLVAVLARVRADASLAVVDTILFLLAHVVMAAAMGASRAEQWQHELPVLLSAPVVFVAVNTLAGLYGQVWRHASIREARRLALATCLNGAVLSLVSISGGYDVPLTLLNATVGVWMLLAGAVRFQARLFAFQRRREAANGLRIVVLGAGRAGALLLRDVLSSPRSGLIPVAVLDDNERLQGRRLHDVPVAGGLDDLARVVRDFDAHQAVLAIPGAPSTVVRRVERLSAEADVPLRVLPSVSDLVAGRPTYRDLRRLRIDDLLGRTPASIDDRLVHDVIHGRRVMVTGAGGSIGSEIARQVAAANPGALLLLDHDETHLHDACATLNWPAVQLLADIRDRDQLHRIFRRHRPDVVFHAAALKHVPLLELHPCEAVLSNIVGTAHVLSAAREAAVERFIFISTDKAVRPSSVMGASKLVGEQLVQAEAAPGRGYASVRFGNVMGSRGSVVPTFVRQIEAGGPVTVTDPRMTRYFMSIPEAVQLVLQAAAMTTGGEVFMLEMGEPVPILQLAERMIRLAGKRVGTDVEIRVTGPRPGEKLHEQLHLAEEHVAATAHPSILRISPPALPAATLLEAVEHLQQLARQGDEEAVRLALQDFANGTPYGCDLDIDLRLDLTRLEGSTVWSRSSI